MAKLWYGHFDSTAEDQRLLIAEDWARFIRAFLGDGVKNGGKNLQVTSAGSGMKVRLDTGVAHIQGYIFENMADVDGNYYEIMGHEAFPSLTRIDRLILRLDRTIASRDITPVFLLGEAAAAPVAPALTRNANIWEISLARITIRPGAITIKDEDIIDERLDSSVCGIINSLITADTEGLYNDFHGAFTAKMLALNEEFYHWFNGFQDTGAAEFQAFFDEQRAKADQVVNWYNTVKQDIAKLQTFDFDNMAELPGSTKETVFHPDGTITAEITNTLDGRMLAGQATIFNGDGTITKNTVVYDEDGVTVLRQATVTTVFGSDGKIKEVSV